MPSHLRLQSSFEEPITANAIYHQTSPQLPPKKKQRMSLTSTYMVASTARTKLGREAGRADHDLRLLVGHANLLDSLMIELQEAEREQEAWFNQSVRQSAKPDEPRHIQWLDNVAEADEESDDDSDMDEDEELLFDIPVRKMKAAPVEVSSMEFDEDEDALYDEESDEDELALHRTPSKHSPPELSYEEEEDSDSEDECPSPEDEPLRLTQKQRQAIATTAFYDTKSQASIEDYVLQQPQTTMIAAAC